MKAKKGKIRVMMGNVVAANVARLCRPEVVACYPITPQSEVAETMSGFVADGSLDAEIVEVEGENSAMNVCLAASVAGARTFTATSSYGLVYMYDAIMQASGYRAPVVMINEDVHQRVKPAKIKEMLVPYREAEQDAKEAASC